MKTGSGGRVSACRTDWQSHHRRADFNPSHPHGRIANPSYPNLEDHPMNPLDNNTPSFQPLWANELPATPATSIGSGTAFSLRA